MRYTSIENQIVRCAKAKLDNPRLTKKMLTEWSTSKKQVQDNLRDGETFVDLSEEIGVYAAFLIPTKK